MKVAKKNKNKICFIHVTKEGGTPDIRLLPVGLVAIADYLAKNGFSPTIIHLGLERRIDPSFDLRKYIKLNCYPVVLFDLHWHYQVYHVMENVRYIKRHLRNIKVIIGGFTASFFSNEIMRRFKEVDFIIRGDPEVPLLKLLNSLKHRKRSFLDIPNLTWRDAGRINCNPHSYSIDKKMINGMCFTNFKLIRNHKKYIEMFSTGLGENDKTPIFYYSPGRGCSVNCSFCGGSRAAQRIINNREEVILADTASAIKNLRNINRYNIHRINICFEPFPDSPYYLILFKTLRNKGLRLCLDFECFSLPTKEFIDEFAKSLNRASTITISPESGSQYVRRKNKGMYYSNHALINALNYIDKKNIKVYLAFTAGLPFEEKKDIVKTLHLISLIRSRFRNVEINAEAIALEPASPWYLHKEKYGILSNRKYFRDFYKAHKEGSSLGYRTESLSEADIQAIIELYRAQSKCKYEKSNFLRLLSDSAYKIEDFDFQTIRQACKECTNYTICFKLRTERRKIEVHSLEGSRA